MRAMSGQSTPRPKALVAMKSHKIVSVLQNSVRTIFCISGVVAAVNKLIKQNSTIFGMYLIIFLLMHMYLQGISYIFQ